MSKDRRLGRGLEALLNSVAQAQPDYQEQTISSSDAGISESGISLYHEESPSESADDIYGKVMKGRPILDIALHLIDPNPFQPRVDFNEEEIEALAQNIETHGMLQPVTLRKQGERFQLIAGERRLRAAKKAGWKTIPSYFLVVDDRSMAELALSENLQRKDLNAIEKAIAFKGYLENYGGNQGDLAQRLGLDRSTVSNLMRLLDLPQELQNAICKEELSQGHARALLPLEEEEQFETAARIKKEGWNVRQTEEFVRNLLDKDRDPNEEVPTPVKKGAITISDTHLADVEQQFRSVLGLKVKLTKNERGGGKVVISFRSNDEFERIYQMIHPKEI